MARQCVRLEVDWFPAIRDATYKISFGGAWIEAGIRPLSVFHAHHCEHDDAGIPCPECILAAADSAASVLVRMANNESITDPLF